MMAVLAVATFIAFILVELVRRQGKVSVAQSLTIRADQFPFPPPLDRFLSRSHLEVMLLPSGEILLRPDSFLQWAAEGSPFRSASPVGAELSEGDSLLRVTLAGNEMTIPVPFAGVVVEGGDGSVRLAPRHRGAALRKLMAGDEIPAFWNRERERVAWFLGESLEDVAADGGVVKAGFLGNMDPSSIRKFRRRFCVAHGE